MSEVNLNEIAQYSNPDFDFSEINASTFAGSNTEVEAGSAEERNIQTQARLKKYGKRRRGGVLRYPLEACLLYTSPSPRDTA